MYQKKLKLKLTGIIKLLSPLLIGSGKDENSNIDLLRDSKGNPFIPATSFVGVLKNNIVPKTFDNYLNEFWGYANEGKNDTKQSNVICYDLEMKSGDNVLLRDGVKIDSKNSIVEKNPKEGGKFDYEIIDSGNQFYLTIIVDCNNNNFEFNKKYLYTIKTQLELGEIKLGSKTSRGFGKVKLSEANIFKYNFSIKEEFIKWLKNENGSKIDVDEPIELNDEINFNLKCTFGIKTSILIKSYSSDPEEPDCMHIKSGKEYVLPGTSMGGALRARSGKILNTLNKDSTIILNSLFGFVDKEKNTAQQSRIKIEENILKECKGEIQTRIKIDRFTGGTIDTALFDSNPLFSNSEDLHSLDLNIQIKNCKDFEVGLLLLVIKDLWSGDLALGGEKNIGRGALKGLRGSFYYGNEDYDLSHKNHREKANQFVTTLINYNT